MSWSLKITNGDFTVSSSQLDTVTDTPKLLQDLRCWILERMGTDDMHPDFGSTIDGGVLPDGTLVPGVIGLQDWQKVVNTVNSEIQRIASAYQAQQLNRAKDDRQAYNRVSLTPAEVLVSLSDIQFYQVEDQLQVTIKLQTATGESIDAAFPISSS